MSAATDKTAAPKVHVAVLQVDDWTALYINGKKIEENHSLDISRVLEAVAAATPGLELETHYSEVPEEEIELGIYYPDELEQVDPKLRS